MKLPHVLLLLTLWAGCGGETDDGIEATGTMEATTVTLSALVAGPVESVLVDEGTAVRAGDSLVRIDPTEWTLQLRQAEAALAAAEAQYTQVRRGSREEDIVQAEAAYTSARKDLDRMKELRAANGIPQKQLEDAQLRFTMAEQTLDKLRRGAREEERLAAQARRDQAEAQAALLRKKVSDCTVISPMDATVLERFVEPGEFAAPGGALVRLANLSRMDVMIYVPEAQLPRVSLGQKARVSVDAFPGRAFEGEVVFISPTAEFTPKNIQTKDERTKLVFGVKVRVANPDGALKAGIPADVVL